VKLGWVSPAIVLLTASSAALALILGWALVGKPADDVSVTLAVAAPGWAIFSVWLVLGIYVKDLNVSSDSLSLKMWKRQKIYSWSEVKLPPNPYGPFGGIVPLRAGASPRKTQGFWGGIELNCRLYDRLTRWLRENSPTDSIASR